MGRAHGRLLHSEVGVRGELTQINQKRQKLEDLMEMEMEQR